MSDLRHVRNGGWCQSCGGTGDPQYEHVDPPVPDGWFITDFGIAVQWRHVLKCTFAESWDVNAAMPKRDGWAVYAHQASGKVTLRQFGTAEAAVEWLLTRPWNQPDEFPTPEVPPDERNLR
jgi:hypothetical protein